jgi:PAS domain S-box-containing protein
MAELQKDPMSIPAVTRALEKRPNTSLSLHEASRTLLASLTRREPILAILELAQGAMRATAAALALVPPEGTGLHVELSRGDERFGEAAVKRLAQRAMQAREALRDPPFEAGHADNGEAGIPAGSILAFPLEARNATLGALVLWRDKDVAPFASCEQGRGKILAHEIAMALDNASLSPELSQKAEELAAAQSQAARAEAQARAIVDAAQEAILLFDKEGVVWDLNPKALEMFGRSRDETVGHNLVDFAIPTRLLGVFRKHVETAYRVGRDPIDKYAEIIALRKNGEEFPLEISTSMIETPQGKLLTTFARDFTERKRVEQRLRESEAKYRTLLENLPQKVFHKNENSVYVACNENYARDLGIESQEITGKTDYDFYPRELAEKYRADDARILRSGQIEEIDEGYIQDGEHRTVHTVKVPLRDDQGTPSGILGIFWDITEKKRVEEALRDSEEKYRALIETTGTGYVIIDTEGRVIDANPEYVRLAGRGALHEVVGHKVAEWTSPHDRARNTEAVRRCAEVGFIRNYEVEHVTGDGQCTPIEVNATVVPAAGGVRIVTLCREITDRKRAEQALRESEERYRLLFERNLAGVFRGTVRDRRILDCNEAYAHILGYDSRQEVLKGGRLHDFYEPAEFEIARARLLKEKALTSLEARCCRKGGTPVWVLANVSLIEAREGEEPLVEGTLIDISERKETEQALAQERDLLRALMDNLPDRIYFKDRESRFTRINQGLAKDFGLSDPGQALGKTDFDFFTGEHAQQAYNDEQEVIRAGKPMTAKEEKETWPDGRVTWVSTTKMPFRDADGAIIGTFGVSHEITRRKQMEERLREISDRLQLALKSARAGTWSWNTVDGSLYWDDHVWPLFGLEPRGSPPNYRDFLSAIHPEDREAVEALVARSVQQGSAYYSEFRVIWPDGSTHFLANRGDVYQNAEGQVARMTGVTWDITEGKRAEEELRSSEERYRELFENASDLVFTADLESSRLTSLNRVAAQTFGYSREEAVRMEFQRLIDPRHWHRIEEARARLLAGESAVTLELEIRAKDGRRVLLEVKPRLIYKEGKPVEVQIIGRDITGREAAEMELRHAQKLEAVGRLASGIAHEINTPIQFVGDNTRFLQDSFAGLQTLLNKYQELRAAAASGAVSPDLLAEVRRVEEESDCAYLLEEIPKALTQTLEGVTRVATLVRAMKDFAHPESKERAATDLNKALLSTLTVARNELKYVADVETDFGDLPLVVCNISDLNQVFLNLLVNAAHAIGEVVKGTGEKGKIRVRTVAEGKTVLITISDTGCGIAEGIRSKVFDPFFTTKEVGRGTGQGLAIARSVVVERHKGSLTFESEVGKGTTFYVRLPVDSGEHCEEARLP